jgi:hypothetical protein
MGIYKIAVKADGQAMYVMSFGSGVSNVDYCTYTAGVWSCQAVTLTGNSPFTATNINTIALDNSTPQKLYVNSFDMSSAYYYNYECGTGPTSFTCTSVAALDSEMTNIGVYQFYAYAFDSTKPIRRAISEVQETILIAFVLVVLVIFFF